MTDARVFAARHPGKKVVAVQGLGFVGAAMAAALAQTGLYAVIGVDLDTGDGRRKIAAANAGRPPIASNDGAMAQAYAQAAERDLLFATSDAAAFTLADIVVVDIPFDVRKRADGYEARLDPFLESMKALAAQVRPDALVIVETTVPPGMTEDYLLPLFREALAARGLDGRDFALAHSYERVMPGLNYLKSITDYYRVYAGVDEQSGERARVFLESFINTRDFPLTRLHRPAASEMAKVMENSYRALNIAFLQEWTEFAQGAGVDLFSVLDAIRMRPTHRNIMSPGFGVGGYCLTKDALLADWAALSFNPDGLPLSRAGIRINDAMPLHSVALLKSRLGGLAGRHVTLLGVSYLNDVADTRYSPSETFLRACEAEGAVVQPHDPMVTHWPETGRDVPNALDDLKALRHDAVVLAVRHQAYMALDAAALLDFCPGVKLVLDANRILSDATAADLRAAGVDVIGVGRGDWLARPAA